MTQILTLTSDELEELLQNSDSEQMRTGDDMTGGKAKLDDGKATIYTLFMKYFPKSIVAVAYVSEYGRRKYNPTGSGTGWKEVKNGVDRYGDAKLRHSLKEITDGPYDDQDSGLAHAAQEAWNAMARLELLIQQGTVRIMRGNDIGPEKKPVLGTAKAVPDWD